jgi:hypothetical protein
LPPHLAKGFHILQYPEGLKTGKNIDVRYIPTDFGQGAKDEDWIQEVGKQKGCVITQDININRRKHELELYRKHKIGIFFLRGTSKKQGMSIWEMVQALAKNWSEITNIMYNEPRPFACEITLTRKMKKL